jgi:hypothetical protein
MTMKRLLPLLLGGWTLMAVACGPPVKLETAWRRTVYSGAPGGGPTYRLYYIQLRKKPGDSVQVEQVWIGDAESGSLARYILQQGDRILASDSALTPLDSFTIQARPDTLVKAPCPDSTFEGAALVRYRLNGTPEWLRVEDFEARKPYLGQ